MTLVVGCGSGPTTPRIRTPTSITIVSGDQQNGVAGANLAQPITIRVSDATGGIPDVEVSFTVIDGAGAALPSSRRTDPEGLASGGWRVGTVAGALNRMRVAVGTDLTVTFTATVSAGPAALVSPTVGVGQFAVVGTSVTQPPRVQVGDAFGNPIPGIPVFFSVAQGGGTITGPETVSDATGQAQVGGWTLGPAPGPNTLRAIIGTGTFSDILATGTAAALEINAGANQGANAGTFVAVRPTVRAVNLSGGPLSGVMVTFTVVEGGGSVTGSLAVTDANGLARPTGWSLGLTPGTNVLSATAPGIPSVTFTATGVQAIPAVMVMDNPGPLLAFQGNFLTARPALQLLDAQGNPVAGAPVVFDVVAGLGTVYGGNTITDPNGRVQIQAWRLGLGSTTNTLRATTPGLAPTLIAATAEPPPPQGEYHIEIHYIGLEPTPAQRAAFDAAVVRWERIIVADLPDEIGPIPASGSCPEIADTVDDIRIFVRLETIDGAGGVLGSAGPCWIRDPGGLTLAGAMRFDVADLATLEGDGQLQQVILHEMAHVIGLGSLWRLQGLLTGFQTPDPFFIGPAARTVFPTLFGMGASYPGNHVPVHNADGPGSRDTHWREGILNNELMTPFLDEGPNPLSALSLVSLRDMGYVVDDAVGDFYEIVPTLLGAAGPRSGRGIQLPPVSTDPIRRWPGAAAATAARPPPPG